MEPADGDAILGDNFEVIAAHATTVYALLR
jgi:hypothetical protein